MAMSEDHKAALAQGRKEARAIKAYLKAIETKKPGRPVTKESLEARLFSTNQKISAVDDPLRKVDLIQTKLDIEDALAEVESGENLNQLEDEFVEHASAYSDRKGVSYSAWREFGVPAAVLKRAGVAETRRR